MKKENHRYMDATRTNGGMTGDSSATMARVLYVDALALRRADDAATFGALMATMQADQARNTWMSERCRSFSLFVEKTQALRSFLKTQLHFLRLPRRPVVISPKCGRP